MTWISFAALTGFFYACANAFSKKCLSEIDQLTFTWAFFLGTTVFLALIALPFGIPEIKEGFFLALLFGSLGNVVAWFLYFRAIHLSDLSLTVPMISFGPAIILITEPLIVGNAPGLSGLLGVLLVVVGSYLLNISTFREGVFEPFYALVRDSGPRLMIIVVTIWAITSTIDQVGVKSSSPMFWSFALVSGVTLLLTPLVLLRGASKLATLKQNARPYFLAVFSNALMFSFQNFALGLTLVVYVISVKRIGILFSILFGVLFFGERGLKERLFGATIMIAGVLIIALW